jgi:dihydropteroate synthase
MTQIATSWKCEQRVVSLQTPVLVGILNITPDSFSDGGEYLKADNAVARAREMEAQGATILDIGGESTRPGAARIPAEEQIERVVPVIQALREESDVCIAIDTTLSKVAAAALKVGANIINDVSAGLEDEGIFVLAAHSGVGLVLMHRRLPPELDTYSDEYAKNPESEDVVQDIIDCLEKRIELAMSLGVQKEAIAIDPGLGFGKSVEQNWQIVCECKRLVDLGFPVYVGASRKSFIGATTGISAPKLRDEASVSAARQMAEGGVQIFRVHDVLAHARMLQSQLHQ